MKSPEDSDVRIPTTTILGPDGKPASTQIPQCLIVCPHSSDGKQMFEAYPELLDHAEDPAEDLERYLRIEPDIFSAEWAMLTAHILATRHNLLAHVMLVNVNRGFLDLNRRDFRMALRSVINWDRSPELRDSMKSIMIQTLREIRRQFELMRNAHGNRGITAQFHTMAPFTPKAPAASAVKAIQEAPGKLAEYNEAFCDPAWRGPKRPHDLVAGARGERPIADLKLLYNLLTGLKEAGHVVAINNPYPSSPVVLGGELCEYLPSVMLDMRKDAFSREHPDSPNFDLSHLTEDPKKTEGLAEPCAEGIHRTVSDANTAYGLPIQKVFRKLPEKNPIVRAVKYLVRIPGRITRDMDELRRLRTMAREPKPVVLITRRNPEKAGQKRDRKEIQKSRLVTWRAYFSQDQDEFPTFRMEAMPMDPNNIRLENRDDVIIHGITAEEAEHLERRIKYWFKQEGHFSCDGGGAEMVGVDSPLTCRYYIPSPAEEYEALVSGRRAILEGRPNPRLRRRLVRFQQKLIEKMVWLGQERPAS